MMIVTELFIRHSVAVDTPRESHGCESTPHHHTKSTPALHVKVFLRQSTTTKYSTGGSSASLTSKVQSLVNDSILGHQALFISQAQIDGSVTETGHAAKSRDYFLPLYNNSRHQAICQHDVCVPPTHDQFLHNEMATLAMQVFASTLSHLVICKEHAYS